MPLLVRWAEVVSKVRVLNQSLFDLFLLFRAPLSDKGQRIFIQSFGLILQYLSIPPPNRPGLVNFLLLQQILDQIPQGFRLSLKNLLCSIPSNTIKEIPDHILIEFLINEWKLLTVQFMRLDVVGSLRCLLVVGHMREEILQQVFLYFQIVMRVVYKLNELYRRIIVFTLDGLAQFLLYPGFNHSYSAVAIRKIGFSSYLDPYRAILNVLRYSQRISMLTFLQLPAIQPNFTIPSMILMFSWMILKQPLRKVLGNLKFPIFSKKGTIL